MDARAYQPFLEQAELALGQSAVRWENSIKPFEVLEGLAGGGLAAAQGLVAYFEMALKHANKVEVAKMTKKRVI